VVGGAGRRGGWIGAKRREEEEAAALGSPKGRGGDLGVACPPWRAPSCKRIVDGFIEPPRWNGYGVG
jgi:hypothetical protein